MPATSRRRRQQSGCTSSTRPVRWSRNGVRGGNRTNLRIYKVFSTLDADKSQSQLSNEAAQRYIEDEGFAVLPAELREKEAYITGWNQLILGGKDVDAWFPPDEPKNIVRVNGDNSGGRGDIDLDRPEALRIAEYLVPQDALRFGREGKILGHVDVRFADT